MKYPGLNGNGVSPVSAKHFSEQFETVLGLFDQWNDCERTVALCALLKRIPYSNLKFLEFLIDNNLAQAYNSQPKLQALESNANNAVFLNKLVNRYKSYSSQTNIMQKEATILYDASSKDKYESREEILNDILTYLLLLRPGNEEAKATYFNFIPIIVDDAIRQIVSTELVQHMFSYLLIHPAINNEDRRSLSHWLRHLQDHMSPNHTFPKQVGGTAGLNFFLPNVELQSPYPTSSTSSLSSSSWQTVAPPSSNNGCNGGSQTILNENGGNNGTATNTWDLHKIQVTQDFCDDLDFTKSIGGNSSAGSSGNNHSSHASKLDQSSDDHHVSFSKNGTEILDFDFDDFKSNTAIGFETCNDTFLTVPGWEHSAVKTRRSNSLTTSSSCGSQNPCSSAENLASMAQKPRSFSLSTEGLRGQLTSAGSETRLDDLNKPNYPRYSTHNVGMSNIGQWLKSLRLHKYVWLFSNLSYDQMLDITEEYLENLGVTKGARHKLVICINKLKDRFSILQQMEKDLTTGVKHVPQVLEDLTNIVMTPMKPVDMYSTDDVAGMFFRVLDYISTRAVTASNHVRTSQDEDTVNVILWILERALHNEAFVAQTNQLKEHKYKLSKLKSQFTPKGHYNKNSNTNGGVNKIRWNNKHKSNSSDGLKPHRKNSNPMQNFPSINQTAAQQPVPPMFYHATLNNNNNNNNNNNYNKSSSYPNFAPAANSTILCNAAALTEAVQRSLLAIGQTQHKPVVQQQSNVINPASNTTAAVAAAAVAVAQAQESLSSLVYRHSLNNLISLQQIQNNTMVVSSSGGAGSGLSVQKTASTTSNNAQQPQPSAPLSLQIDPIVGNNCIGNNGSSSASDAINCENSRKNDAGKLTNTNLNNSIGDINSRLEFLCLQMTEQAIN